MLADNEILELVKSKHIVISGFSEKNLKAGKYDVLLGRFLLIPDPSIKAVNPLNLKKSPRYFKHDLKDSPFVLEPQKFVLGQTNEEIGLSSEVGMFIDGSTTLARIGLTIHQSATYIPPGQDPHIITLEMFNCSPWSIVLSYEMKVGKLIAFKYNVPNTINAKEFNKYNGQKETTGADFNKNKDTSF